MKSVRELERIGSPKSKRETQILQAAFEEFAANGYAAARMDDVARRARIAKGTIFLHFRDKKALFRAVLCDSIRPARSEYLRAAQEGGRESQKELCDLLSRQYVEFVGNKKARALLRLLIAESAKFPELAQIYYHEVIEPGAAAIGFLVEKGVASGEFRGSGARRFPQILFAPALLAVVWKLLLGKSHEFDLESYRQAHLDFIVSALSGTNPTNAFDEPVASPGEAS